MYVSFPRTVSNAWFIPVGTVLPSSKRTMSFSLLWWEAHIAAHGEVQQIVQLQNALCAKGLKVDRKP